MGVQTWLIHWVQHEHASFSENSPFIWIWQGSARMFTVTRLIIDCRNLQHCPFENQHQRMLATPMAQTRRSLRGALYHFFFFSHKFLTCTETWNMKTLTAEPTGILSKNGEMPWIGILTRLRRWRHCFVAVSLTSYRFCTGHSCISETSSTPQAIHEWTAKEKRKFLIQYYRHGGTAVRNHWFFLHEEDQSQQPYSAFAG